MKRFSTITIFLATTCAWAQDGGYLGTKVGGVASTGSQGPGVGPFIQMVLALGIVLLLLKAVAPKIIGKLNRRLVTNVASALSIEETASFAGGTLYIIRAKAKTLLVCVSSSGVTCLSDLTETEVSSQEPPTFSDVIEKAKPFEPKEVAVEPDAAGEVHAALERLERLAR